MVSSHKMLKAKYSGSERPCLVQIQHHLCAAQTFGTETQLANLDRFASVESRPICLGRIESGGFDVCTENAKWVVAILPMCSKPCLRMVERLKVFVDVGLMTAYCAVPTSLFTDWLFSWATLSE